MIGIAVSPERAAVQLFPLRDGRMVDRYSFHLENAAGEELSEVLEQFCLEYYGSAPSIPPQILVPRGSGDLQTLEEFLTEARGSHVELAEHTVNGKPGLVARQDGVVVTVFAFDVADERITRIWAVRNPDKLTRWNTA